MIDEGCPAREGGRHESGAERTLTRCPASVFFNVRDVEVCARSAPKAVAPTGYRIEFTADLDQMHLLDPESDQVV